MTRCTARTSSNIVSGDLPIQEFLATTHNFQLLPVVLGYYPQFLSAVVVDSVCLTCHAHDVAVVSNIMKSQEISTIY